MKRIAFILLLIPTVGWATPRISDPGSIGQSVTVTTVTITKCLDIVATSGGGRLTFCTDENGNVPTLRLSQESASSDAGALFFETLGSLRAYMQAEAGGWSIGVSTTGGSPTNRILFSNQSNTNALVTFNENNSGYTLKESSLTFDSGSLDPVLDWTTDGFLGITNATFTVADFATVDTLSFDSGLITDSGGAISFGNENLTTTGTLASGVLTVTGNATVAGDITARDITQADTSGGGFSTAKYHLTSSEIDAFTVRSDFGAADVFVIDTFNETVTLKTLSASIVVSALTVTAGSVSLGDNANINLGTAADSKIVFDTANLILDPDVIGAGKVLIGATGDDDLEASSLTASIRLDTPQLVNSGGSEVTLLNEDFEVERNDSGITRFRISTDKNNGTDWEMQNNGNNFVFKSLVSPAIFSFNDENALRIYQFHTDAPSLSIDARTGEVVFNQGGNNYDFRVETPLQSSAFQIDGGNENAQFNVDLTINQELQLIAKAGSAHEGDIWNDSTQEALQTFVSGIEQTLVGAIFTQTADQTIANTVTETTLFGTGVGTLTLPANFWAVGKTIRIEIHGDFADTGNPTAEVQAYYGATSLIDSGAIALAGLGGTEEWKTEVIITCRSVGATGTLETVIDWEYETTTGSSAIERLDVAGTTTVVDTTASGALDVTFQWGTAVAANTITSTVGFVEVLN